MARELQVEKKSLPDLPPCALITIEDKVVIGTYRLNEETKVRDGSLDVYSADLDLLSSVPTESAILDVRYHDGKIYTAQSTGSVQIWRLVDSKAVLERSILVEDGVLVLQIMPVSGFIAATLSTGEVAYIDTEKGEVVWKSPTHSLEAWTCEFDESHTQLYSGGDDAVFAMHDVRMGQVMWKMRHHDAGVTSISIRPDAPEVIWTGGYDDKLRVVDGRSRREQDNIDLGGGVWRLIPSQPNGPIIACCMYGGLRVLEPKAGFELPVVIGTLTNHESMVYGAAWSNDFKYGYSCSFYDRLVQKWTPPS